MHPNWSRIAQIFAAHDLFVQPEQLWEQELEVMREMDDAESIQRTRDQDRLLVFFRRVLERTLVSFPESAFDAAVAELLRIHGEENLWEDVFADVQPALSRLRALGLRLIVLSNANGTVRRKLERVGLGRWFEVIVDSGEEGVEKPDPRFFERGLWRGGANPDTTLHVGDMYHVDILGARAARIPSVLIDRGDLNRDRDCVRFGDLLQLTTALEQGRLDAAPGRQSLLR